VVTPEGTDLHKRKFVVIFGFVTLSRNLASGQKKKERKKQWPIHGRDRR
jgi:hypothetical protein